MFRVDKDMFHDRKIDLIFVPDGKSNSMSTLAAKVDPKKVAASGLTKEKPKEEETKEGTEPKELSKKEQNKLKKKAEKAAKKEAHKQAAKEEGAKDDASKPD